MFLDLPYVVSSNSTYADRERRKFSVYVRRVLKAVNAGSSPHSGSLHQADHANPAQLRHGEVNDRIRGGIVIDLLTRIWVGLNLDRLPDLILKNIDASSDFDTGDLRFQRILRVRKLRRKNIDHDHLTAGKNHIDSEAVIIMEDDPLILLRGHHIFGSLGLTDGLDYIVGR